MNRKLSFLLLLGCMMILTGCCQHKVWNPADCVTPKTCAECGEIEGEELGHSWVDATCEAPRTCKTCGVTEGEALGHSWVDATCEAPRTCEICGITEGEALGHSWMASTTDACRTCSLCGITGAHYWIPPTCQAPQTCVYCGMTLGDPGAHTWGEGAGYPFPLCTTCGVYRDCPLFIMGQALPVAHKWVTTIDLPTNQIAKKPHELSEKLLQAEYLPCELRLSFAMDTTFMLTLKPVLADAMLLQIRGNFYVQEDKLFLCMNWDAPTMELTFQIDPETGNLSLDGDLATLTVQEAYRAKSIPDMTQGRFYSLLQPSYSLEPQSFTVEPY